MRTEMTPAQEHTIRTLYAEGMLLEDIKSQLGVGWDLFRRWRKELDLPPRRTARGMRQEPYDSGKSYWSEVSANKADKMFAAAIAGRPFEDSKRARVADVAGRLSRVSVDAHRWKSPMESL